MRLPSYATSAVTYHVYCRVIGSAIALLLHVGNSVAMYLAMRSDRLKDRDIANLYASQFKYLTIWNVAIQLVYSMMNLICDIPLILKVKEDSSSMFYFIKYLRKYRKIFFGGVVFPTGVVIFIVFWPFFLYDRELIFPAFIDKTLSHTSNQIMHTAILPITLWELLFQPRCKPNSHILYLSHLATIYFFYLFVLLANYVERGTWPYPLFTYLYGTIYFPGIIIAFGILYVLVYYLQWPLTSLIYDTNTKSKKIK